MIPLNKLNELKKALEESARPLVFFDDDPDGLCSFLQFYKLNSEAKGIIYKAAGPLNEIFLKKVEESNPDAIFILDVAEISQEFLDKVNNVYWLDHHTLVKRKNVNYLNPMSSGNNDNRPTSYWAYQAAKKSLWIAMVGCVGDWFIPEDLREEFFAQYPELLPETIKKPEDALFSSPIGKLSRVFSFVLKGNTKDAMGCVKILTRIDDPYEILEQRTSKAKFIWKKYQRIEKNYQEIKSAVKVTEDKLILFLYNDDKMSLTSDLSNEILYENPEKFIIIGREKSGEMKCSLRSSKYDVLPILEKALKGVSGYGGGHLHACGANIKKDDFEKFLENVRNQL